MVLRRFCSFVVLFFHLLAWGIGQRALHRADRAMLM